jgi:hypothetical protein
VRGARQQENCMTVLCGGLDEEYCFLYIVERHYISRDTESMKTCLVLR